MFTIAGLDSFISHNLSALTKCNAPDLSKLEVHGSYWNSNFILHSIFDYPIPDSEKPFFFAVLHRAEMLLVEYQDGKEALEMYVQGEKDDYSTYFRAVYRFQLVVSLLYQLFKIVMKRASHSFYEDGDGSPMQRLNTIYNDTRHLKLDANADGVIQTLWITNDGLEMSTSKLSWRELEELIQGATRIADRLANPTTRADCAPSTVVGPNRRFE